MHLVIHDASLRKVAFVDNTKQNTLKYVRYEWYRSLETAGSTFNVTILKKAIQTDNHYEVAYNHLNERSFITFKAKNKTHLFNVMVVTENEETITCECESANLELINEYANPYKATKAMKFVEYCNAMDLLSFTYLTVGLNEISDQKRTLQWEGQDTKLARLLSLANKFDAEIEFDTRLNVDSSIKQFILNVYHENDDKHQGVGRIREDVQLVYGKNIKSVTRTIDKTNVVNAIRPTGTKDGNTVVISGLGAWEEKNADGIVEFFQKGEMLYAPISMQLYPSAFTSNTTNDQWTRKDITVDSDNPTVIRTEGIKALKRLAYPSITYEVDGFFDGEIGDTVKVIDHGFVPKLILKARVIEQYIYDDETKNKTVLGNFTALENRLSDDIQERLNELVEKAKPYTIKLSTDNGVVFKNNIGQSIVTPKLYKGGQPIGNNVTWRWALDGNVTTGMTYTVRGANVTDTATLTIAAYIGNDEVAVDEISFVNVFDGTIGTPGTPGKDGRTPYVHTAWANNATGTSGFSLDNSVNKLYIGIYTDFEPADSQDPARYKWMLVKGEKGDKGDDGVAGKDGTGIDSTIITYASSSSGTSAPTTGWGGTVPTVPAGNYLWTKTVWNYSDGTSETGYSVARIGKDGNTGADGIAGKDGVGIKTTTITYAKSTNGTTAPTSGWTTSVPIAVAGDYIWTKTVWVYTDNTTETGYSVGKIGNTGPKGDTGADGVAGKDGKGITGTVITYGISASETTQPTNWTASVPTLVKGQYLWTKTVWTYTDSTNETGYTKTYIAKDGNNGTDGIAGKDGVGISSTSITYARSTSGTSAPSTGWTSSVPTVPAGEFLWTKTVWTYTDNTNETGYSVAKMGNTGAKGEKGDPGNDGIAGAPGVGIQSTVSTYGLSANETTQPTSWTSTVPSLVKGQYLWTKNVWTYTNGRTETGYTKTYIPKDGNNGTNGIAGKDGVGISSTNITYASSSSGTTAPTSGWSSSVPSVSAGNYLWTKTVWTYTDNTNETGYSVARMGANGAQGPQGPQGLQGLQGPKGDTGIQGPKGADGKSSYTHIAYATNSTGTAGFSTSDSANKSYIGMYVDNVLTDSTEPSKYKWTLIKGADGAQGIAGAKGADGRTPYLHIAYATNSTGTTGFSVTDSVGKTYIGQYTDYTQADSTDPTKYRWSLIKGEKGDRGETGPQGPAGPQGERGIAGATGATGATGAKGADGRSSYIHIKYSPVANPTDSQITDTPNAYIGVYTDYNQADSTRASAYTWTKWQGKDGANGVAGAKGADGKTTYVHFAYANSANGQTNFNTSYFEGALYVGTLTDYNQADSTNYAAYTWSRLKGETGAQGERGPTGPQGIQGIQGPQGVQGIPGVKGADGKTQYTHIAYADMTQLAAEPQSFTLAESATVRYGRYDRWFYKSFDAGTYSASNATFGGDPYPSTGKVAELVDGFSQTDQTKAYIGMYQDFSATDSTNPASYKWTKWKGTDGAQGIPGPKGADGKTPYVHFAYADNADGTRLTLTDNGQRYIGHYSDYTQADSTDKTKYRWADRWAKIDSGGRNYFKDSRSRTYTINSDTTQDYRTFIYDEFWKNDKRFIKSMVRISLDVAFSPALPNDISTMVHFSATPWYGASITFKGGTTARQHFDLVYDLSGSSSSYKTDNVFIRFTNRFPLNTIVSIDNANLYISSVSEDYRPAVEELEDALASKADQALTQEQLNLLIEKAETMQTELEARASMETLSDLERAYNAYVEANDKAVAKSEADLIEAGRRVDAMVETLGGLSKTKTFIETYIKEAEEGIIIGTNDNVSQIRVTYDRIAMYSAGKEVMYISQGVINIDNGVFTKSLQIGRFRTEQHPTNLDINVCRYVG